MSGQAINPGYLTKGTAIGAYQVVGQVAGGGFGFVYRVLRDGHVYALKIGQSRLSALAPDERASSVERLEREIAALTSLHHPNIVRVHSFERWPDLEGGFPYLVMDFVDGTPLQEWRAAASPALSRLVAVFEKVAEALEHMHKLGIIHRDLKSQNILVRSDGEPFIVDFGIARPLVAHDVTQAAGIGTLTHLTPEYVAFLDSPESKKGHQFDWRPATDLYALGYVLYEALTGQPPVPRFAERTAKEEFELLSAIKTTTPGRPRELLPLIPQELDDLVMQLLEKSPEKRPPGAAEVAARLRQARDAGKAASDPIWVQPFDLPGTTPPKGDAVAARAGPPAEKDGEDLASLDEEDSQTEAPARREPAASGSIRAVSGFSAPTTEDAKPFDDGGEKPEAKPEATGADRWSRESQILKRAAGEFAAAMPRPRRWPLVAAAAAGGAVLLFMFFVGLAGTGERPGPKTLLSAVEAGASPAASQLSGGLPEASISPAAQQPPPAAAERSVPGSQPGPTFQAMSDGGGRAMDKELPGQAGRLTILPDGRVVTRPALQASEASGLVRSRRLGPEPQVLQWSQPVAVATKSTSVGQKSRGVPYGAHIQARLLTNLDTRTIGNGPVEALLPAPYVVRGRVLLPTRTMVYGTATESGGRFTIRFTRLRLPDDTEVAFEGIALARDDGKPGLAASGRIGEEPKRGEGLGKSIAKGTGNILLDTITGGTGQSIVRNAGQAALGHEEQQPVGSQWALLLDAGGSFDIFVERAF